MRTLRDRLRVAQRGAPVCEPTEEAVEACAQVAGDRVLPQHLDRLQWLRV